MELLTPEQCAYLASLDYDEDESPQPTQILRLCNYGDYIDSTVKYIYQKSGKWYIDTTEFDEIPMTTLQPSQIVLYQAIDWQQQKNSGLKK